MAPPQGGSAGSTDPELTEPPTPLEPAATPPLATGGAGGGAGESASQSNGGTGGSTAPAETGMAGATGAAVSMAGAAGAAAVPPAGEKPGLLWPLECIPEVSCGGRGWPIGHADIDDDGQAHNCEAPGYAGHQGTDIPITWDQMDAGMNVLAAAAGEVLWVFDGKFDRCPDAHRDCQGGNTEAGSRDGWLACTELGPYCQNGRGSCFWCFFGGNVVVIRHDATSGVFATRYDHLRQNSIVVEPGQRVQAGQVIAQVGSAGNSSGPHLHFEVWQDSYYDLAEPWAGQCGPNMAEDLWRDEPPWAELLAP